MAVQVSKATDITDRLNVLAQRNERPTEFEVRLLKREIDDLKNTNAAQHYMLLGMLYSIAGQGEISIENHERSLRLSQVDVVYLNYALSLRRLGKSNDALVLLLKAPESARCTVEIVTEILNSMIYSGDFSRFDEVITHFRKSNPGFDLSKMNEAGVIVTVRDALRSLEIPESEYRMAMGFVESIVFGNGYLVDSIEVATGSFDGVRHIYTEFGSDIKNVRDVNRLNDLIADAFADAEGLTCWDRMVFSLVPTPRGESGGHRPDAA